MNFKDKTVMITGSVRNTGRGIAEAFAAAGARVIINGRKATDTQRVADELRAQYGVEVIEATMDIAVPTQVDNFFDELVERKILLDVLVNNAVIQAQGYSFTATPYDMLQDTFKVNVFGMFHCSQRAALIMQRQAGGAIINIGSNTAKRPIKERAAYVASKGAVDALTRAMAVDLAAYNIRVNTVEAGYIHSDRWSVLSKNTVTQRRNNIPLGHECSATDIARAVMFLASVDYSPRTTGSCLTVDGGCSTQLFPADCDV